jgi:hypothetical protein
MINNKSAEIKLAQLRSCVGWPCGRWYWREVGRVRVSLPGEMARAVAVVEIPGQIRVRGRLSRGATGQRDGVDCPDIVEPGRAVNTTSRYQEAFAVTGSVSPWTN